MTKKEKLERKAYAIKVLTVDFGIKAGDTLYTSLRRVSASGMTRIISVHFVDEDRRIRDITSLVASALDSTEVQTHCGWGIKIHGCGMDMGYHVIDNLSYVLGLQSQGFRASIHQQWI